MTLVATTETPTTARVEVHRQQVLHRLDELRRAYRSHISWLTAVHSYLTDAGDAPDVRKMPSKTRKAHMYSAAHWMIDYYVQEVPRPTCLSGIARVITAVELKLIGQYEA